jgi:predicted MFS family arabinose efflux permease
LQLSSDEENMEKKRRATILLSGFSLTLFLRILTVTSLIVLPIFMHDSLGVSYYSLGLYVALLWIGNAAGTALAAVVIGRHLHSSMMGFSLLSLSFVGLAGLSPREAPLILAMLVFLVGVGMGMPQPFLSSIMHLSSEPSKPFTGIGLYSIALAIGVIVGPFAASLSMSAGSFSLVFLMLALVALLGFASALINRFRLRCSSNGEESESSIESQKHKFSIAQWIQVLRKREFSSSFVLNFLFSMLLPVFISYGGVFGEYRFGLDPIEILILFTSTFIVSALIRVIVTKAAIRFDALMLSSVVSLIASFLLIGIAPSVFVFLAGALIFSVPHALILPITNYYALRAVNRGLVMNASYAFQVSSGVAEFISPILAAAVVSLYGLSNLFVLMLPIAFMSLFWLIAFHFPRVAKFGKESD